MMIKVTLLRQLRFLLILDLKKTSIMKIKNRKYLELKLKQSATESNEFNERFGLLFFDIDHFKNVNDTYGHDVGDVVIRELGQILRSVKRDTDSVARFGGEEFCILC